MRTSLFARPREGSLWSTLRGVELPGLKEGVCAFSPTRSRQWCSPPALPVDCLASGVFAFSVLHVWPTLANRMNGNGCLVTVSIGVSLALALRAGHLFIAHSGFSSVGCLGVRVIRFPCRLSWLSHDTWLPVGQSCLAETAIPMPWALPV